MPHVFGSTSKDNTSKSGSLGASSLSMESARTLIGSYRPVSFKIKREKWEKKSVQWCGVGWSIKSIWQYISGLSAFWHAGVTCWAEAPTPCPSPIPTPEPTFETHALPSALPLSGFPLQPYMTNQFLPHSLPYDAPVISHTYPLRISQLYGSQPVPSTKINHLLPTLHASNSTMASFPNPPLVTPSWNIPVISQAWAPAAASTSLPEVSCQQRKRARQLEELVSHLWRSGFIFSCFIFFSLTQPKDSWVHCARVPKEAARLERLRSSIEEKGTDELGLQEG